MKLASWSSHLILSYVFFFSAEKSVKVGDQIGWGMLLPAEEETKPLKDRLIICYLTINRSIVLTRVMFRPPGGLYPIVILPADGMYCYKPPFVLPCNISFRETN